MRRLVPRHALIVALVILARSSLASHPLAAADEPPASPLAALRREDIPAYELKAAALGDPAYASPNLVAILGDSRLRMMSFVRCLAFTPDGKSLVSAGNQEVAFWDAATGELRRVFRGHTERVDELAISRDGQTLITGSFDRMVKIWDVATGKERLTLKGHQNFIAAVAFSPDGKIVASADSEVRTWDISRGRRLVRMKRLGEHQGFVHALAFSPDGKTLVSAGDDGKIQVWDVASAHLQRTLSPPSDAWQAVAFSPDGKTLAVAGQQRGLILMDTATWSIRHQVPGPDNLGAEALAFSPDSRFVVAPLGYFAAHRIDVATGKEVWSSPRQSVGMNAIAVSPNGATVATTGHSIRLWDVASGREKTPALSGHRSALGSVAFSPDGATLATGGWDSTIRLWDLATRRERRTLDGHKSYVESVAFSPDGRALASIGISAEVILWDLASGKRRDLRIGGNGMGRTVLFSPDGRRVGAEMLSAMPGPTFFTWDRATGERKGSFDSGDGSYHFTRDGKKLVFAGGLGRGRLVVWDVATQQAEHTIEGGLLPSRIDASALGPDGRILAMAGRDYQNDQKGKPVVILWGLAEEQPLYRLDLEAKHLAFSPDGRTLLAVGRDGLAHVVDPRNGTLREIIRVCEPGEFAIHDITMAPDSRHFAAALGNGTARIFRLAPAPAIAEPREPLPEVAARPETPTDLWKRQLGRPAPELRAIQAWAGGPPVRLADLRGKFVLLYFWGHQSSFVIPHLMDLHEKFADHGLVIVVIQPDWHLQATEDWQARSARGEGMGGRRLPFRIALDGNGPTPIEGSDAKAPGPTFAAFGVQDSRDGRALPAINLILGPDGRILAGDRTAWNLERDLEAHLRVKARVPAWRQRFDRHYALADGQALRRIGPTYPPEREDFLFYARISLGSLDPGWSEVFRWDGRLRHSGTLGSHRLRDVLGSIAGLQSWEMDGPAELLDRPIPGDWVLRPGATRADLLKALEPILVDELKRPARFAPIEVERDVIVAAGRFQFRSPGGDADDRAVHLTAAALPANNVGGGGSGTLVKMLDWLGDHVGQPVIDETESSGVQVVWRDHLGQLRNEIAAGTDTGRASLDRVLDNLAKQTSLTFRHERRKVKVWRASAQ